MINDKQVVEINKLSLIYLNFLKKRVMQIHFVLIFFVVVCSCFPQLSLAQSLNKSVESETNSNSKASIDSFYLEKQAYKKLGQLVLNSDYQKSFNSFIDTMNNYSGSDLYYTNLNFILDFIEKNDIPFLIRKNKNNSFFDSTLEVTELMNKNFNIQVDLSSASEKYQWNDFNCTIESDKLVRNYGFQYGFVDTESDENIILIHKISDEKTVRTLVKEIGYNYFIADD